MDRVDGTVEDIPEAHLPENLLSSPTNTEVSTRSRCGASLWTHVAGRHAMASRCSLSRIFWIRGGIIPTCYHTWFG